MTAKEPVGIGMTSVRTRDRLIDTLRREGIEDDAVLERMRNVPRHLFVDEALASRAYENTVLPIGYGQTISQPYIVALMTQVLLAECREAQVELTKVLEIGTGSGYQTAILAPFVRHVYGIERVEALYKRASRLLRELGVNNVSLRYADGLHGWPSQAPFQGILVAAAPASIPTRLLEQLDEGGRMLIPIGQRGRQSLLCVSRHGNEFDRKEIAPVSFVPLVEGTEN